MANINGHYQVAEHIREILSEESEPIAVADTDSYNGLRESYFRVVTASGQVLYVMVRERPSWRYWPDVP